MTRPFLLIAPLLLSACAGRGGSATAPPSGSSYTEEEVVFQAGERAVSATWTLPDGRRDVPAVLLIPGSGPTDRDWNSPLLAGDNGSGELLAHALAERGVASLRYDKYGLAGLDAPLHWDDYRAEQAAGVEHLLSLDRVDSVWVAGHSEGGLHALDLASRRDDIAGVALLAAPGRSLFEVLVDQIGSQVGEEDAVAFREALAQVREGNEGVHVANPRVDGLLSSLQHPLTRPFLDELLVFDPTAAMSEVDEPIFIISGARDIQISLASDADALEGAARTGQRSVTRVDLPHADHVFKLEMRDPVELERIGSAEYNSAERRLDPGLADALARWVYR